MDRLTFNHGELGIDHRSVFYKRVLLFEEKVQLGGVGAFDVRVVMEGEEKISVNLMGEGGKEQVRVREERMARERSSPLEACS